MIHYHIENRPLVKFVASRELRVNLLENNKLS